MDRTEKSAMRFWLPALGIAIIASYYFWPMMLIAVIAAARIRPWLAVAAGIVADILYGAPPAGMPFFIGQLYIPFTILSLAAAAVTHLGKKSITAGEWHIREGR
jgi:hypothetical protein